MEWAARTTTIIISLLGLIAVVAATSAAVKKAAQEDGEERGSIGQKLDNITIILTDVKRDIDDMKADARENRERIVRIETCNQHTEKRLDGLSEKVRRIERRHKTNEEEV